MTFWSAVMLRMMHTWSLSALESFPKFFIIRAYDVVVVKVHMDDNYCCRSTR